MTTGGTRCEAVDFNGAQCCLTAGHPGQHEVLPEAATLPVEPGTPPGGLEPAAPVLASSQRGGVPLWTKVALVAIVVLAGVFVATLVIPGMPGGRLEALAKDTCAELEGAIVLQVGPILSKAISKAGDMGVSGSELGDAMRTACPATMAAIEKITDDQKAREDLPTLMEVEVTSCSDDGAGGTVRNGSGVTVDVFIDVQYLDSGGVVVDDGIGSISGLRAGEAGKWDSRRIDDSDIARCRADVSSAYGQ